MPLFGRTKPKRGTQNGIKKVKSVRSDYEGMNVDGDLEQFKSVIRSALGENTDLAERQIKIFGRYNAVLYYFDNMVDHTAIHNSLLKPLMHMLQLQEGQEENIDQLTDMLLRETLYFSDITSETEFGKIIEAVLSGKTAMGIEGVGSAIVVSTRQIDRRSIEQPATEQVIRGPREGFIESLGTNISLLRYRLQSPDLRIVTKTIGERTRTTIAVCYMNGITSPSIVEELDKRLSKIDIDGVFDSGYVEQFIEDNHWSPFPQVQYTERPDKVAANLLEGRAAVLVDGSPLALLVPTVFSQFYQTVEDYTERFLLMSAIRLSRLVALVFSLVFPSLYVAIISFNPELIPTEFAVAVAGGRAGVPFPAVIEVLIMEVSMEVLREATIRLPQQVGGALSIVGVLVIGQAAVSAGFASPITVVIIALTTIGSFATPAYNVALALRLLRFPLIIMAGIFGLYGVMIGLILIANHLLTLKSFGVPYLSPMIPGNFEGMKDFLVRGPFAWMKVRPAFLRTQDDVRINVRDLNREGRDSSRKPNEDGS